MNGRFDVVFGFDMETDVGSFTDFYNGVQKGTPRLLEVLSKHKAPSTFFWTGHAASNNKNIVEMVRDADGGMHETGCHSLVHETLGDAIFPLPNNWPVFPFEVEGRIREATRLVKEASGIDPTSFRCPRLWGSTKVVNVLEELGYKADATLPLYFYRTMFKPYHPDKNDWTREGDMKIVEIPNFCDLTMESNDPYNRDRDQWPLFRTEGADALMKKVWSYIDYVESHNVRPVLCFYLHPWEYYEMPTGVLDYGEAEVKPHSFITKNCGDVAVKEMDKLLTALTSAGAVYKTAGALSDEY